MSAQQLDHKEGLPFNLPFGALNQTSLQTYTCLSPSPSAGPDKPPKHSIRSINWNPFGNLVATGAADKTLRVCKFSARPRFDAALSHC